MFSNYSCQWVIWISQYCFRSFVQLNSMAQNRQESLAGSVFFLNPNIKNLWVLQYILLKLNPKNVFCESESEFNKAIFSCTSKPRGRHKIKKGKKLSMFVNSGTWVNLFPFWLHTHISAYVESIWKKKKIHHQNLLNAKD